MTTRWRSRALYFLALPALHRVVVVLVVGYLGFVQDKNKQWHGYREKHLCLWWSALWSHQVDRRWMQGREGGWYSKRFQEFILWQSRVDSRRILLWGLSMQYQRRTEWLRRWRTAYVLNWRTGGQAQGKASHLHKRSTRVGMYRELHFW